jgi:hypothetical protein
LAVLKEGRSLGEVVLLDTKGSGDVAKAPKAVQQSLASVKGSLPQVVVASADGSTVFGSYSHEILKAQNFSSIFRDAKKAMREYAKNSTPGRGEATASTEDGGATSSRRGTATASAEDEEIDTPYQWWTSTSGSRVEARLVHAGRDKVTLKAKSGREITIEKHLLDAASLAQAEAGR